MGCNCKNNKKDTTVEQTESKKNSSIFVKVLLTITKVFIFTIASLIGSVIVIPFTIFILYKTIFQNKSVDVTNMILGIVKPLRKGKGDDDNESYEDIEKIEIDDEVILLNEQK